MTQTKDSNSMTTYKCGQCSYSFTRLTNMEPEKRLSCINCESWMYPLEENESYGPLAWLIDPIINLFRGK